MVQFMSLYVHKFPSTYTEFVSMSHSCGPWIQLNVIFITKTIPKVNLNTTLEMIILTLVRCQQSLLYKWLDRCVSAFLSSLIATSFAGSPSFGLSMCRCSRVAAGIESSSLSKIRHVVRRIGKLKAIFAPFSPPSLDYVGPDVRTTRNLRPNN